MNSKKTADAVRAVSQSSAQSLLKVQARFTEAFAAGEMLLPGDMERLLEAQALATEWAKVQRRWNRAGLAGIADYFADLEETLIDGNVGGSTSLVANAKEAIERKTLQAVYKILKSCR